MSKITVVGMAPFSVSLEVGSVSPGQIRKVDHTPLIDQHIESGILAEVATAGAIEIPPARKPRITELTESPKESS